MAARPGGVVLFPGNPQRRITVTRILSDAGRTGIVSQAKDLDDGSAYAIKSILVDEQDKAAVADVSNELQLHKSVVSEHVIRYYGIASTGSGREKAVHLLFELGQCSVVDYANANRGTFNEDVILGVLESIVRALCVVHSLGIIHRDVKPGNVLLGHDGRWKLTDFGSATRRVFHLSTAEDREAARAECDAKLTPAYRAPEAWQCMPLAGQLDAKLDIWALGVTAYELCYGSLPFGAEAVSPLAVINAKYTLPASPAYSPRIAQLLALCLQPDPARRPDAPSLLRLFAAGAPPMSAPGPAEAPAPDGPTHKRSLSDEAAGEGAGRGALAANFERMREAYAAELQRRGGPDDFPSPASSSTGSGPASQPAAALLSPAARLRDKYSPLPNGEHPALDPSELQPGPRGPAARPQRGGPGRSWVRQATFSGRLGEPKAKHVRRMVLETWSPAWRPAEGSAADAGPAPAFYDELGRRLVSADFVVASKSLLAAHRVIRSGPAHNLGHARRQLGSALEIARAAWAGRATDGGPEGEVAALLAAHALYLLEKLRLHEALPLLEPNYSIDAALQSRTPPSSGPSSSPFSMEGVGQQVVLLTRLVAAVSAAVRGRRALPFDATAAPAPSGSTPLPEAVLRQRVAAAAPLLQDAHDLLAAAHASHARLAERLARAAGGERAPLPEAQKLEVAFRAVQELFAYGEEVRAIARALREAGVAMPREAAGLRPPASQLGPDPAPQGASTEEDEDDEEDEEEGEEGPANPATERLEAALAAARVGERAGVTPVGHIGRNFSAPLSNPRPATTSPSPNPAPNPAPPQDGARRTPPKADGLAAIRGDSPTGLLSPPPGPHHRRARSDGASSALASAAALANAAAAASSSVQEAPGSARPAGPPQAEAPSPHPQRPAPPAHALPSPKSHEPLPVAGPPPLPQAHLPPRGFAPPGGHPPRPAADLRIAAAAGEYAFSASPQPSPPAQAPPQQPPFAPSPRQQPQQAPYAPPPQQPPFAPSPRQAAQQPGYAPPPLQQPAGYAPQAYGGQPGYASPQAAYGSPQPAAYAAGFGPYGAPPSPGGPPSPAEQQAAAFAQQQAALARQAALLQQQQQAAAQQAAAQQAAAQQAAAQQAAAQQAAAQQAAAQQAAAQQAAAQQAAAQQAAAQQAAAQQAAAQQAAAQQAAAQQRVPAVHGGHSPPPPAFAAAAPAPPPAFHASNPFAPVPGGFLSGGHHAGPPPAGQAGTNPFASQPGPAPQPLSETNPFYSPPAPRPLAAGGPGAAGPYLPPGPAAYEAARAPESESWELDLAEIEVERLIGRGAFGEVFKGTWRGTEVAVKKLLVTNAQHQTDILADFRSEVRMLRALRHPHVVLFMGVCMRPPNFAIVTEFCARGTLFDVLQNRSVSLDWATLRKMAEQAAKGVNYLHCNRPPIIHRDLKSTNLLVDEYFNVKVADFGLSRMKSIVQAMTGQCGTFQYMAPEVLASAPYTEKADVYSFGMVLWEMATRQVPFYGLAPMQVALQVVQNGARPPLPPGLPPYFASLITRCWDASPEARPSFAEIIAVLKAAAPPPAP